MFDQYAIGASCRTLALACALSFVAIHAAHAAQESTIFRYDGQDFIRAQTTLRTQDGKPATNTKLDRASEAYKALREKRSYSGDVTVFGQQCDSHYAPLTDVGGKLTGALFIGICTK